MRPKSCLSNVPLTVPDGARTSFKVAVDENQKRPREPANNASPKPRRFPESAFRPFTQLSFDLRAHFWR